MISLQQSRISRVLLCIVLSVLLHVLLALLLLLPPPQEKVKRNKQARQARAVKVVRTHARKQAAELRKKKPTEQPAPHRQSKNQPRPTVKTSADTPQALPDQPDYEGKRSTRAASAPDARHRASANHAPAMNGEEKKELVTFEQERQEGDLQHEGKKSVAAPQPAPVVPPRPEPTPPAPEAPAEGRPDGRDTPQPDGQDATDARTQATNALTLSDNLSGALRLQQEQEKPLPPSLQEKKAARRGVPGGTGNAHTSRKRHQTHAFYDPSLAEWAQPQKPGFRTHERRSRSSGRFVLGRGAALNVVSTPRGEYEALVYRRVAYYWYRACDEHRGDIIPGKITISLRITRRGQIDSMALIKRSGASISQQSFTFKAIRKASLPPMPEEVQADVIGKLMELIFEFNFD